MPVISLRPGETFELSVIALPAVPSQPPLGIWGPGDPRPTNPIAGFDPIHGTFPDRPPLGFWGPGDPRPTNPIAGFDPIHGTWPDKPPPTEPPSQDQGHMQWVWVDYPPPFKSRWVWARVPGEGEAGPKAA